ncbi:MAG: V-type ATP synthase subunit D [Anaerolineaceae bacterium]|nr:V-type ATP synthase subunit D [Anaerolineaceae bacterium]
MSKISTTRIGLIQRKELLELAEQAQDLLERKRTALMQEIETTATSLKEDNENLKIAADQARVSLVQAESDAGFEAVQSAALANRSELNIRIESVNIMGVKVPRIEQIHTSRSILKRGYSISGTSILIDETAEAFETEVDAIIKLADSELRLKSFLTEIKRTTRRLRAIEQKLIPQIKAECAFIELTLDERERADHARLKLAKKLLEKKRSRLQKKRN